MTISKVIKKYKFNEQPNDFVFWQSRSYEERLDALEQIRKQNKRATGRSQDLADAENLE